jgi:peptidoglycan/xylan/chitin deacetylase (PgdA/CDA1 family)
MSVAASLKRALSRIPKYIFRRPLRELLCRRPLHANLSKPIISFTFDDFPRSAWTVGGRILTANDMHGTYYISLSLMGSATHLGEQFTRGDLAELLENEHEAACHTFSHYDCRAVRLSAYLDDITRNRNEFETMFPGRSLRNHAFPSGRASLPAKHRLARHFDSIRGVHPGLNVDSIDLNLLRANSLYSNSVDLGKIKELIQENDCKKGWLIFYTHDICNQPSAVGCTTRHFEQVVQMAGESNALILTIKQSIDHLLSCNTIR